jgi:hypothetical protein
MMGRSYENLRNFFWNFPLFLIFVTTKNWGTFFLGFFVIFKNKISHYFLHFAKSFLTFLVEILDSQFSHYFFIILFLKYIFFFKISHYYLVFKNLFLKISRYFYNKQILLFIFLPKNFPIIFFIFHHLDIHGFPFFLRFLLWKVFPLFLYS